VLEGRVEAEKVPERATPAMSSTARASSSTGIPATACLIILANSLSITSWPKSKVTPDSIIPAP